MGVHQPPLQLLNLALVFVSFLDGAVTLATQVLLVVVVDHVDDFELGYPCAEAGGEGNIVVVGHRCIGVLAVIHSMRAWRGLGELEGWLGGNAIVLSVCHGGDGDAVEEMLRSNVRIMLSARSPST